MPPSAKPVVTIHVKILSVQDGDSFHARLNGKVAACRLYGIDAPELPQPFGRQAKRILSEMILGHTLRGSIKTLDCYGRVVVDLWAFSTIRVAVLLLRSGAAWHTPRWSPDRHELQKAMNWARDGWIGLWAQPHPIPPWTWRRNQGHDYMHSRGSRRRRLKHP